MPIIIRKAEEKDFESCLSLLNRGTALCRKQIPDYFTRQPDNNVLTKGEFLHCYINNNKMHFLVAEEKSKVIGLMTAMIVINGNTHFMVRHHSWLDIIHYDTDSRENYIQLFSLFMNEIQKFAREQNIERLYCEFPYNNEDLREILSSHNFSPMFSKYFCDI